MFISEKKNTHLNGVTFSCSLHLSEQLKESLSVAWSLWLPPTEQEQVHHKYLRN